MEILAIVTFFFIAWGLGYGFLRLVGANGEDDVFHQGIAALAVGLSVWSFLGAVLALVRIPIHVAIAMTIAAAYPAWVLVRHLMAEGPGKAERDGIRWPTVEQRVILAILILAAAGTFWLMHTGANAYPYLEDDDPWNHAQSVSYIAREHTYRIDPALREINPGYTVYLEPYPPTYDALLAQMHQLHESLTWVLKTFNTIIIALTVLFAYLMFNAYLKSRRKAIFATIAIAALPSFMSHFIWSQTLGVALFAVGMYAFLRALEDKTWWIPAVVCIASELVSQPVSSLAFGMTLILVAIAILIHEVAARKGLEKTKTAFIVGAAGLATSFLYWGDQLIKWGVSGFIAFRGGDATGGGWAGAYALQKYSFNEVVFPPVASRIDQAIGWGLGISILALIGVVAAALMLRKTSDRRVGWQSVHALLWFALFFFAVFGPSFGLPGWGSHRAWVYLAFPLAALAAVGAGALVKAITKDAKHQAIMLAVLVALVVWTSLPAKVAVQTAQWPPGVQWTPIQGEDGQPTYPDLAGHILMGEILPKNTRVFTFCGGDQRAIGFDMQSDPWVMEVGSFRQSFVNATGEETIEFLRRHKYEYITIDATCVREHGADAMNLFLQRLSSTGQLQQVRQANGFLLAKVM